MNVPDPRQLVEAPVRRELMWLVARGMALVAVVAAIALLPLAFELDVPTCDRLAMAAPAILIGYALLIQLRRQRHGGAPDDAREAAWTRAAEVDPDDAALGRLVSTWVPIGLLLSLILLLWPHLTDENPALAAAWSVLGVPPVVLAWLLASSTWLDGCRDDLARAEGEADARFRRYWANVGR